MSDSLWPQGLQHTRLPCPSPSPGVYSNSCPLSQWCHPTISSSVVLFSFCLQSFPASGSFPVSQAFTSGGQSIGASDSASGLPMSIQGVHISVQFSSVAQLCLTFGTPWNAENKASLSITNSRSLPRLMSIESVMPSNHILCHPLLFPSPSSPSIFPSIRDFSNESLLHIGWPKYWTFSFSISPSNKYLGLISFRIDWFDLLAIQRTLKSLLQQYSSKASVLHIRWPKYWSFSFSIGPFNEYSGLISFRTDLFNLLAVQGTLKESSPTPQFKSINSLVLSFLYNPTMTTGKSHPWLLEKP